jgi:uncharacterized protein (TIGR00290 family)
MDKVVISWSGGKDSALALHDVSHDPRYRHCRVEGLLTTVTRGYERISGHGVHIDLLRRQAERIGVSLRTATIDQVSTMDQYSTVMAGAYRRHRGEGVQAVVFGDIFLKGPKKAHLAALHSVGMNGVFPLWRRRSAANVRRLIDLGFAAVVICVDGRVLDASFLGRRIDAVFLDDLPPGVDPAGENGEYHTFVTDGPGFRAPLTCVGSGVVARGDQLFWDFQEEGSGRD